MPKDHATDAIAAAMVATPLLEGVSPVAVQRSPTTAGSATTGKGRTSAIKVIPRTRSSSSSQGRVEIGSVSVTGNRVLHATVDTPQFVGELGVLAEIDRTASVLTLEDSERLGRRRRGLLGVPGGRALRRAGTDARARATGPVARGVRGRPALPRPQGPGGEAAPADGHAFARRSARGRHRDPGRHPRGSREPVRRKQGERHPRALGVPAARPCWNATGSATS